MKQVQERKPKHVREDSYCVRCDYRVCPVHRNQDHGSKNRPTIKERSA